MVSAKHASSTPAPSGAVIPNSSFNRISIRYNQSVYGATNEATQPAVHRKTSNSSDIGSSLGDGEDYREPAAPVPAMYWSKPVTFGRYPPKALRAHSMVLVNDGQLFIFGGCDARVCFKELYIFDADTMYWTSPQTTGQIPSPRRAHSCTLVEGRFLYVFGGGDGPNYFNDLYVLNTETLVWVKPEQNGDVPGPRRAHTTCFYNRCIYLFGGGDGARALNDTYRLDTSMLLFVHLLDSISMGVVADVTNLRWQRLETSFPPPVPRGYHSMTLVGSKLVVIGGSDGQECFSDCHFLDLITLTWHPIPLQQVLPRLAHSATLVGSYLFVIGGHDGLRYSNEVLLFNLVTMTWETRKVFGKEPSGRGYHAVVLYDSRLFVYGGYDGSTVFDEVWILELSASAYLPQIINFEMQMLLPS